MRRISCTAASSGRVGADVVDGGGLPQQAAHLPTGVGGEVAPHSGPQVGRLAHVEHPTSGVAEQVHARRAGESVGEGQLRRLGMGGRAGEGEEIVEGEDAEGRPPARAGGGAGRRWPARRRGPGDGAGDRAGAESPGCRACSWGRRRARGAGRARRCRRSGSAAGRGRRAPGRRRGSDRSKRTLWPTKTASPMNSSRLGSTASIRGAGPTIWDVMPGQHGDGRRDRPLGIDHGVEGAEALAAPHLDRSDLADAVVVRRTSRGLEVEDAERDVDQRCAEVVEAGLPRGSTAGAASAQFGPRRVGSGLGAADRRGHLGIEANTRSIVKRRVTGRRVVSEARRPTGTLRP